MTEIVCNEGVEAATVARVTDLARVSRNTYYRLFADRDECLLAVFDATAARAAGRMRRAYEAAADWEEGVRAGLLELLLFLDEDRQLARFCVGSLGGDDRLLERRARVLAQLAAAVDAGRAGSVWERELPPFASVGVVGAGLAMLYAQLLRPDDAPLVELWGPLMAVIALPYRGPRAARRELALRSPRGPRPTPPVSRNGHVLLERLGMRVTYRTMRVLGAIAEHPGATSVQVARAAEIRDQAQISKLLRRLAGLGLIENLYSGAPKHAAKAWRLTDEGLAVNAAMRELVR